MDEFFRPHDAEFQVDPYPAYHRLRETSPIHRTVFDDDGVDEPAVILSRWRDCAWLLRDPRFSAEKDFGLKMSADPGARLSRESPAVRFLSALMLVRDPPDHTRLRMLVNKAFTPRRVEMLRPRVQTLVDELLDRCAANGGMDVIPDFATPLPVRVIAELLGVPGEDHERLKAWSDRAAILLDGGLRRDNLEDARKSLIEFAAYLAVIVAARKQDPRDDLISALVGTQEADDRLTDVEVIATCLLILGAGHETTTNLIGNGVRALLDHPGELDRLRRDPGLIRPAVEELLRFDSPVQVTSRVPTEDVELDGEVLAAGVEVNVLIGAANRDPEIFPEPDRLLLDRRDNRHLSFGFGVHFCLGAPLARLEGEVAIATLSKRFPNLALAGEPKRRAGFVLRGYDSLPLQV